MKWKIAEIGRNGLHRFILNIFLLIAGLLPTVSFGQDSGANLNLVDSIQPISTMEMAGCSLDLPGDRSWTKTEHLVWNDLCSNRGGRVDLSQFDETDLPCQPNLIDGDVPDNRILSNPFITVIFTDPEYSSRLHRGWAEFKCLKLSNILDLSYSQISISIFFKQSNFPHGIMLLETRIDNSLGFFDVQVDGSFDADRISVAGTLFLRNNVTIEGDTDLFGAHFSNDIEVVNSHFNGFLNLDSSVVGGDLTLTSTSVLGDLNLSEMSIAGKLSINDSEFGSEFKDAASLRFADIGGNAYLENSIFHHGLNMDSASIGGFLLPRNGSRFGKPEGLDVAIDLQFAQIGNSVSFGGAIFEGQVYAEDIHIDGSMYLRGDATFQNGIDLNSSFIGGQLHFGDSSFSGFIDLSNAIVAEEILISSSNTIHGVPSWGEQLFLNLRNATAKAIEGELFAWKKEDGSWIKADLTGFKYEGFGGMLVDLEDADRNMANASADQLIEWLETTQRVQSAQYSPQSYQQLAYVLNVAGKEREAKSVLFAKYEHQRLAQNTSLKLKIWLTIAGWVWGHGVYPQYALYWFAGLVALGIAFACGGNAPAEVKGFWARLWYSNAPELKGFWARLWYSIDIALPFVQIDEAHSQIKHNCGLVGVLFHFQKLLGFGLATVFIGALTVLGG